MAIIFFKIMTLVVRTMAKPVISWVSYYKRMKLQESDSYLSTLIRQKLTWTGQQVHYYNTAVNRKVFRLGTNDPIKPLTDDKALEKGAEFLSEVIIYSILISIPIYEWWKTRQITKEKEARKKTALLRMENDVRVLKEENERLKIEIANLMKLAEEVQNKI